MKGFKEFSIPQFRFSALPSQPFSVKHERNSDRACRSVVLDTGSKNDDIKIVGYGTDKAHAA